MTLEGPDVNGALLIPTPKTYLALSAVGEPEPQRDEGLTDPSEAALRDERDPMTVQLLREQGWTETELALAWGYG